MIVPPNAYWTSFSLSTGKERVFKLTGKVAKCAQNGTFDVGVAAYIVDAGCSTPIAAPVKVRSVCMCVPVSSWAHAAELHDWALFIHTLTCLYKHTTRTCAQVVIAAPRTQKRPLPACPPSPNPSGPVQVYPMQRPVGAQPAPPGRRLQEADATGLDHRALALTMDECIARCGTTGLSAPFYAAMNGDRCFCSPGR